MRALLSVTPKPILVVLFFVPIVAVAQQYHGPKCLGAFCVDRDVSAETLAERLGPLSEDITVYKSPDGRAFLSIIGARMHRVGIVSLRDSWPKSVDQRGWPTSKEDLSKWGTTEGIRLGSSEEDVQKAYGKPSGEVELLSQERGAVIEGKRKTMFYKGRLNDKVKAATFRMVDGRVSEVELENNGYIGPECLGAACIIEGSSLSSLMRRLGANGQKASPLGTSYCYKSENEGTFLYLTTGHSTQEVEAVEVGDFPNCARTTPAITKRDLHEWKTPEGIGLGSSEEDVLKAYGKPAGPVALSANLYLLIRGYRKGDKLPDIAEKVLAYGGEDFQVAQFGIRSGKVSYILVSIEE